MSHRSRLEMTDEPWRTAELVPVVAPSAWARRARIGAAAFVALGSLVVLFVSWGRSDRRCGQSCFGAPPNGHSGSLSYEPGHPWTRYTDSWEWSAQGGLAYLALAASIAGIVLAMLSRREAVPAFTLAAVTLAGWLGWVLLSPSTG